MAVLMRGAPLSHLKKYLEAKKRVCSDAAAAAVLAPLTELSAQAGEQVRSRVGWRRVACRHVVMLSAAAAL